MSGKNLPETVVGIDLETTSLDPAIGHIIEVAAIRFSTASGQEVDRYQALCFAPFISSEITALTGIDSAMVEGKSTFQDHIPALKDFIGRDTLLAHNGAFDLAWFAKHGLPLTNSLWDTFYLASLVWPQSHSYNLGTLAREHGIVIEEEHRASQDIVLTWGLFQEIRKNLQTLPQAMEKSFEKALESSGQSHYFSLCNFRDQAAEINSIEDIATSQSENEVKFSAQQIMAEKGLLSQAIPNFIPRSEQIKLTEYLLQCCQAKQNALVEAAPGVGKTFAYLVAGIVSGGRLLISTHSKILQDQIISKDLPQVLKALGATRSYGTLKGRRNYICGARLAAILKAGKLSPEDAWAALKIALWLEKGGNGDLENLNLSHQGRLIHRLHADHLICRENCRPETCPYQKARELASRADIVIINHALLMQWSLSEENPRQAFAQLIVDEAHQLEDAARKATEIEFSREQLEEILQSASPLLSEEQLIREKDALIRDWAVLLGQAQRLASQHAAGSTLRLSRTVRRSQGFHKLAKEGNNFLQRLRFVIGLLRSQAVTRKKQKLLQETLQKLEKMSIQWEELLAGKSQDRVQYIQKNPGRDFVKIVDTSLEVAEYIQPFLDSGSTLLLSATLTAEGKFSYIKNQLGLTSWAENTFSGVFEYSQQMAIAIVDNGPYPGGDAHDLFGAQLIKEVGKITQGKMLVLLTSKKSLEAVHKSSSSGLYKENIRLLSQGISGGRHNIAKRFQDSEPTILLGLSSFWEGFDSPGEALSVLIIPKLPFPVVGDPIIEALTEVRGNRAFDEIMLPKMILRLRQGVGRLIRSVSDRGIVIVLDRRLAEKEYGRKVLHSFPACPVQVVDGEDLPNVVAEFFGPETIARWQESK